MTNPNKPAGVQGVLLALAEKCEAATGPDRELDAEIWLHLPGQEDHAWKHGGDRFKHARQIAGCGFVPALTASIDAALTLVPDERKWEVSSWGPSAVILNELGGHDHYAIAATPALALCEASLRARAALASEAR